MADIPRWKAPARSPDLLDVSLDWLLLGRGTMDWHRNSAISATELQMVLALRNRSAATRSNLVGLVESIPPEHA